MAVHGGALWVTLALASRAPGAAAEDRTIQAPATEIDRSRYPDDVHLIRDGSREIVLVGTAHISQESTDLVREVIENEKPDRVCVELDEQRYKALSEKTRWENLDLKQIIKKRQLTTLVANLLLASYQRKLGDKLGVIPGTELLEATRVAQAQGAAVSLCDREIRITMLRAWRSMSLIQKSKLLTAVMAGVLGDQEISEDELRRLRKRDVLTEMMQDLATALPSLKRVLIDERDCYLAEKIRRSEGQRIVAVVGAGHVNGILEILGTPGEINLDSIREIPVAFPLWKWIGWGIPIVILASLVALAWTQGAEVAGRSSLVWILANGIPSAFGALLALAHPLTILTAFVAAPLTSLTPVIGAGYVTAFVQAYLRPPLVRDFHSVVEDAGHLRNWWRNRLLRILLAFVLPGLGSMLGTFVGGYEILSNLFSP